MKHIFVVNPIAGQRMGPQLIRETFGGMADCEIRETAGRGEAISWVRARCAAAEPGEELAFIACGGDGTLNEVASGIGGFRNALLGVYPCGSGNDFVKAFGGRERFLRPEALLHAEQKPIDLLRVGDRWCINAFHFGFDSAVARTMNAIRKKPLIGGSNAYPTGVAKALICDMKTYCRLTVDGEAMHDGPMLLCTIANGQYVGGSYRCAPRSLQDDGLAEVCLVKPVSRVNFLRLMGDYKQGSHLDNPRFEQYIRYRQARVIEVHGKPGFAVSMDGEVVEGSDFRVEVVPKAIRFLLPPAE